MGGLREPCEVTPPSFGKGDTFAPMEIVEKGDTDTCEEKSTPLRYFIKETKCIVQLAFPIFVSNILLYLVTFITVTMAGRLPQNEFDAACLALSFITTYATSIMTGASTSCDTMFSQSMGSVNKKRTGLWLQKGLLILNLGNFLLASVHVNAEPLYLLIGQDPEVARLAADFSVWLVPGIFFYTNFLILIRFLQNIDCTYPPIFILIFANVVNFVIQYLALFVFNAPYYFLAIAISISFGTCFVLALGFIIIFKKYKNVWDGFQREALTEWFEFTKLTLCGIGHYAFESMCLNLGIILAGTISTTLLASQTILHQFETLLYMIPGATSVTVNIRVGQSLGRGDIRTVFQCLKTFFILIAILVTSLSITIMGARNQIPLLFTTHSDIIDEVIKVLPTMVVVIGLDCFRGVVDGALRGCGRQMAGAVFNFVCAYLIGLPAAIPLLLYTSLRLTGFWLGIVFSLVASLILASICLARLNWERESVRAQTRVLFAATQAMKTTCKKSERTPLLPPSVSVKRIRTAREPRSCSTNFEVMKEHQDVPMKEFRILLLKRGLTYGLFVAIFLISLITNFAVPHDLYRHLFISANSSMVLLSNTSQAFYNVTPA